jgi:hypothetical protein
MATPENAEANRAKALELKQRGIILCGSSCAIFAPVLLMLQHRGMSTLVLSILLACWLADFGIGLAFILRSKKLLQQGSERNG